MTLSIPSLILFGIFCSILSIVLFVYYILNQPDEPEETSGSSYTEEEIILARFLEDKQAINEAFLSAQAELLKELQNS